MKTQAEIEWEEKYGSMTQKEIAAGVKESIGNKLTEITARKNEQIAEQDAIYILPYGEYSKVITELRERIADLDGKPEKLKEAKRAELEAEYAEAKKYDRVLHSNKELWVSEQLLKYLRNDEEYLTTKSELLRARTDLAIYLAKKEEWEENNADIIEAERYRTRRAELLSADDETLRALGIEPEKKEPDKGKQKEEKRYRYGDPNASFDDLLKQAVKDMDKQEA